jgi:hypothetical protein
MVIVFCDVFVVKGAPIVCHLGENNHPYLLIMSVPDLVHPNTMLMLYINMYIYIHDRCQVTAYPYVFSDCRHFPMSLHVRHS